MRYTTFFIAVLAMFATKIEQIESRLQVESMEDYDQKLDLNDPSWNYYSSGILKSHRGLNYEPGRYKTFTLSAPKGYGLLAAFRLLDLRPENQDYVTLSTSGRTFTYSNKHSYQKKIYDEREEKNTLFAANGQLVVTFFTGPSYTTHGYDGFEFVYTVQANSTNCKSGNFHCRNQRCISDVFECDGHNHCGDRSDQVNCSNSSRGRTAGIAGGVIFLVIAVACAIFIAVRRAKRSKVETRATIISHPPTTTISGYPPSQPQPGTCYPPPPPPYSPYNQGITNPGYH